METSNELYTNKKIWLKMAGSLVVAVGLINFVFLGTKDLFNETMKDDLVRSISNEIGKSDVFGITYNLVSFLKSDKKFNSKSFDCNEDNVAKYFLEYEGNSIIVNVCYSSEEGVKLFKKQIELKDNSMRVINDLKKL